MEAGLTDNVWSIEDLNAPVPERKRRSTEHTGHNRSRIAGMKKVPAKLKLFLYAWLRQPKDEMDQRQDANEIQPLFPPKQ
jgi:hypothetical protein